MSLFDAIEFDPRVNVNFKDRPVLITDADAKKMQRRITMNCAGYRVFGSVFTFGIMGLVTSTIGVNLFAHFSEQSQLTSRHPIIHSVLTALLPTAALCAVTMFGTKTLGEYFEYRVHKMDGKLKKELIRREAWKDYQRDLTRRIKGNIAENKRVFKIKAFAENKTYLIPALRETAHFNDKGKAVGASLGDFLPQSFNKSFTKKEWKAFARVNRIRHHVMQSIANNYHRQGKIKEIPDGPSPDDIADTLISAVRAHVRGLRMS